MQTCKTCNSELALDPNNDSYYCNNNNCIDFNPIDKVAWITKIERQQKLDNLEDLCDHMTFELMQIQDSRKSLVKNRDESKEQIKISIFLIIPLILVGLISKFSWLTNVAFGISVILAISLVGNITNYSTAKSKTKQIDEIFHSRKAKLMDLLSIINEIDFIGREPIYDSEFIKRITEE